MMMSSIGNCTANTMSNVASSTSNSALTHAEMREDTAIQRAVLDMKSAGINPILGFNGASAASSASASTNLSSQAQKEINKANLAVKLFSSAAMLMLHLF